MKLRGKVLTVIKYSILIGTFLFLYITYQGLPDRVQIHFGGANNFFGSKIIILFGNIIVWLFGFIPWPVEKVDKLHAPDSEEIYREMVEDEKVKAKIIELILAILVCSTVIFITFWVKGSVE